jgi:Fe2+ transport system protein FeoA
MMPVALLSPGEHAEVVRLGEAGSCDASGLCRASDMGLRCGQTVQMLSNTGSGPILLKVGNTRIAIGRSLARQVLVSIVEGDRL